MNLLICQNPAKLKNLDAQIFCDPQWDVSLWSEKSWHDFLAQENQHAYLLYITSNATPCGLLAISETPDFYEIIRVGVLPQERQKKIAHVALQNWLHSLPPNSRVLLEVSDKNQPALALYKKLGFEKIAQRKNYYPHSHAHVMQLKL